MKRSFTVESFRRLGRCPKGARAVTLDRGGRFVNAETVFSFALLLVSIAPVISWGLFSIKVKIQLISGAERSRPERSGLRI